MWANNFGTLYSTMIIIYFYCFHSEKLNVLEQIPPAVFGSFELLDRFEKKLEAGCCCLFKISPEVRRKENLGKDNIVALPFPCQLSDDARSSKRLACFHLRHNESPHILRAEKSALKKSARSPVDFLTQALSHEDQMSYYVQKGRTERLN